MQKRASLNEKFNGLAAARFTKQANMLTDMLTAGAAKASESLAGLKGIGLGTGLLGAAGLGAAGLGAAKAAPKINKAIAGMSPEQKKKALQMLAGAGAVGGAGGAAAMYRDEVLRALQQQM